LIILRVFQAAIRRHQLPTIVVDNIQRKSCFIIFYSDFHTRDIFLNSCQYRRKCSWCDNFCLDSILLSRFADLILDNIYDINTVSYYTVGVRTKDLSLFLFSFFRLSLVWFPWSTLATRWRSAEVSSTRHPRLHLHPRSWTSPVYHF